MRFLLVDDQNLVLEALSAYVARLWPDVRVVQATTVAEAIRLAGDEGPFDLVLLDHQMPGMSGMTGLSAIKQACAGAPIVFCSGAMDKATAELALAKGAAGVLTKDMAGPALVAALRRIIQGERILSTTLSAESAEPAASNQGEARRRLLGGLSEREYEILTLLVEGLSNKAIAKRVAIAEGTVKLHLHRVFTKMSARNRADAVRIFLSLR